ncbi:MAG: hypothetical protein V7K67_23765 [Nostoc sp.]|uniref:hypothetical protein n=1 Tax=Nostoc sp. TaxID=1180 RepID=UPI002FFBCA06
MVKLAERISNLQYNHHLAQVRSLPPQASLSFPRLIGAITARFYRCSQKLVELARLPNSFAALPMNNDVVIFIISAGLLVIY